jgi:hypothetical protein
MQADAEQISCRLSLRLPRQSEPSQATQAERFRRSQKPNGCQDCSQLSGLAAHARNWILPSAIPCPLHCPTTPASTNQEQQQRWESCGSMHKVCTPYVCTVHVLRPGVELGGFLVMIPSKGNPQPFPQRLSCLSLGRPRSGPVPASPRCETRIFKRQRGCMLHGSPAPRWPVQNSSSPIFHFCWRREPRAFSVAFLPT